MIFINVKSVNVIARPKTSKNVNATLLSEIKIFYYYIIVLKIDNFVSSFLFLFVKYNFLLNESFVKDKGNIEIDFLLLLCLPLLLLPPLQSL